MLKRIIFLLFFSSVFLFARADIGETFDMMRQRDLLLKENESLLNGRNIDSLNSKENSRYVENLHIINLLDADIFKSQKETIDRIGTASGSDQYVNKSIALLCFLLAISLVISTYMLFLMNRKLNALTAERTTFYDRFKELLSAVLINFQADTDGKQHMAVNRLILLGMLCMFISVVGYLLKTLGI